MNIKELKSNQVFVFGSNLNGHHLGGAAKQAIDYFGAIWGQATGLQGQSYAIATLDKNMQKLPLDKIQNQLKLLVQIAKENKDKEFLLTPIGTGIAGFTLEEIKSILPKLPSNIIKVGRWD